MRQINIRETRQALSYIDRLLAEEGELTITRRGVPIARVVPIHRNQPIPSHKNLRESMPKLRKGSEIILRSERDSR